MKTRFQPQKPTLNDQQKNEENPSKTAVFTAFSRGVSTNQILPKLTTFRNAPKLISARKKPRFINYFLDLRIGALPV
jgi:hypothetical protein